MEEGVEEEEDDPAVVVVSHAKKKVRAMTDLRNDQAEYARTRKRVALPSLPPKEEG